jgi:hypothetical protein
VGVGSWAWDGELNALMDAVNRDARMKQVLAGGEMGGGRGGRGHIFALTAIGPKISKISNDHSAI